MTDKSAELFRNKYAEIIQAEELNRPLFSKHAAFCEARDAASAAAREVSDVAKLLWPDGMRVLFWGEEWVVCRTRPYHGGAEVVLGRLDASGDWVERCENAYWFAVYAKPVSARA